MSVMIPAVQGLIRRRILVNYRVDPDVMARQLPAPFKPKLVDDQAVAGICLIRLEQIRPKGLPPQLGLWSENGAHRVAVTWQDRSNGTQEGVFIFRRDSSSPVNRLLGGRLFPGYHHHATFNVDDSDDHIRFSMRSKDGQAVVDLDARSCDDLPTTSVFTSSDAASSFFECGSTGFSPGRRAGQMEGVRLHTTSWGVTPLAVDRVYSSFLADEQRFPHGTANFDCALVMRDIPHEWHPVSIGSAS